MSRYYEHNGRKLPSVTTICGLLDKPALVHWAANQACDYILEQLGNVDERIRRGELSGAIVGDIVERARKEFRRVSRRAMDVGSKVHAAIEYYIVHGEEPIIREDPVLAGFLAFLEWSESSKMEVIQTEYTVYADRYAGTCDLICMLDGRKYLIDFKTSKIADDAPAYPEHRYQVAAYRQTDDTIEGTGILYLDKESGLPRWRDVSATYDRDRAVFDCLTELWHLIHGTEGRSKK